MVHSHPHGSVPEHRFECSGIELHLGGRTILKDVSLGLGSGEIVGIAGPNGAGKTSLLDVMTGRHLHYSGSVVLDGSPLDNLSHYQRVRRGVCRTYQHPVVPANLTVREVFESARKAFRPRVSILALEWAAEIVGLDVDMRRLCGGLETLDRRKLLLACLIMRRPGLLLLDEPASGLVSSEIDEIETIVKDLAWELNVAIVIVEHRLELLDSIANRVVVIEAGRVIAEGAPQVVFADPAVRTAYFDPDASEIEWTT